MYICALNTGAWQHIGVQVAGMSLARLSPFMGRGQLPKPEKTKKKVQIY